MTRGPFLERHGNLMGPKRNSLNYDPLPVKTRSFNVSDKRKDKITAKFQSTKRVPIEDTKRFLSPVKFRDF